MKKIYFVRHGESDANSRGLAAGSEFDSPLTDRGREQARQAGRDLKSKKIEVIVASPMQRAVETAEIIAGQIGYDPIKILKQESFVERNMGIYSGGPDEEYLKAAASGLPLHDSVETPEAMHKRILEGLERVRGFKEQRILIVSHGGVSRILRLMHQKLPYSHMYRIDRLPNAEVYEFDL